MSYKEREHIPNKELLSLRGKNALVTGGAMGIGFGITQRLVDAGAQTIIADLNQDAGREAIQKLGLEERCFVQADVSNPSDVGRIVSQVVKEFGSVDILVNNAGIYPFKPMIDMSLEEWQKVITTNLSSTFLVNQAVAKQMIEQGKGGKIVNIGSVDSLKPWAIGSAAYDASKAGILGMSRSLALELAPYNITVNVVAPGDIDTPGSRADGIEPINLVSSKIPLGRRGTADDIAKVVLGIVSPMGDYMTGTITVVDGGWMLTSSNTPHL